MDDAGCMTNDSTIEATVLLCDAAAPEPSGKMHMLGAGWSITGTPTAPSAVVVLMKLPWDRGDTQLPILLRLVDADGHPVMKDGKQLGIKQGLGIARRPELQPGVPIDASFSLPLAPMVLPPGRYRWLLEVEDQQWSAGFTVMPPK